MEQVRKVNIQLRKPEFLKEYGDLPLEEKIAMTAHMKPEGQHKILRRMGVDDKDMPDRAREAGEARTATFLANRNPSPLTFINWEERVAKIVRLEIDEGKSQAEIAATLDLSPKTLYEYKRSHRALFKEEYTRKIEDAKTQHLGGYLRGRKKLAGLMGPAVDRLEKEITTGESAGVATRAALGVAKLVLEQDKGGGTAFLLDDDSRVLWERVRTEDPIMTEGELLEPDNPDTR